MARKKPASAYTPDDVIPIYQFHQVPERDKRSVCGVVEAFLPTTKSRGIDYQKQITIKDIHQDPEPNDHKKKPNVLIVKLFAKNISLLPPVERTGDVIYFRQLKVSVWNGQRCGLTTWDTTFVLFPSRGLLDANLRHGHEVVDPHGKAAIIRPDNAGDVSRELQDYAAMLGRRLRQQEQSHSMVSNQRMNASRGLGSSGFQHPLPPRSQAASPTQPFQPNHPDSFYDARYKRIEELNTESYSATIIGEVVKIFDNYQYLDVYVTDYTSCVLLYDRQERESVYNANHKWTGPLGRMTLKIELHDPHRDWMRLYAQEKDIVMFRNVRCKMSRSHEELEGTLWPDRKYSDKVHVLIPDPYDVRVRQLEQRKKEYNAAIGPENAFGALDGKPEERQTISKKKREKKLRRQREREAAEKRGEDVENAKVIANKQNDPMAVDDNESSPIHKADTTRDDVATTDVIAPNNPQRPLYANPRIRTTSRHSFTPFTEVIYNPKRQIVIPSENGITTALMEVPFINVNHRVLFRVVDYHPKDVWSFARPLRNPHKSGAHTNYEWSLTLLVIPGDESERSAPDAEQEAIPIVVDDEAGRTLFGVSAASIVHDADDQKALAHAQERFFALVGSALPNAKEASSNESSTDTSPTQPRHTDARFSFWARRTRGTATTTASPPFEACIREYGVRCGHAEDEHDDADDEVPAWERCICGWRRVWGLHSTKVVEAEAEVEDVVIKTEKTGWGTTREEAIVLDDSDEAMGEG